MLNYSVKIQGGRGPGVWKSSFTVKAASFDAALSEANKQLTDDAAIVAISQED